MQNKLDINIFIVDTEMLNKLFWMNKKNLSGSGFLITSYEIVENSIQWECCWVSGLRHEKK